ncbi:ABC1 kinase family protein [Christiangramia forsetii]|uniref:ABC1 family protein n=2 Tax=Christiangramia forsetii TaxID=411153 RepID=A0M3W1_CHRFK|nr:lipopolysaccharide core heptose(II) kinase RfaY [Christiangramia forsetii]GGG24814.1 ABC transporter [Christiangramia forsetii]CAL67306.1 ABC1 family protein [Christiangramia forsetii KT0803]
MKTIDKIPTGKIGRTGKLVQTGVKIGGNYLKYYGKKAFNSELTRDELDEDNASDIYDGLKSLKGSALKVAQMLSMEKNLLPGAYVEKFSLAQFSVPPLSAPLVRKTFKKYHGEYPEDLYDTFAAQSVNAASIGQVHKATKEGRKLAVKIQYPGVADSISSDLAMVKPIALKMFNMQAKDSEKYFKEVEGKLLEETDYILEVKQSKLISNACEHIPNLKFPKYYEDLSSERIITMDWMDGIHLSEFAKQNDNQELANEIGQALWDFYMFQIHGLKQVHADPHPGNFMVDENNNLIAIDFGCIKQIPDDFYSPYFSLTDRKNLNNQEFFYDRLLELEILNQKDSNKEKEFFSEMFHEMFTMFSTPYQSETFDFTDENFWKHLTELSEKYSKDPELRKMNGNRGSRHFLYMSRTFFGLYNLLHDLKATVDINKFRVYL